MAGANGFFGYGPLHAGVWSRYSAAAYGDLEVAETDDAYAGGSTPRRELRGLRDHDERQVSGRLGFMRGSVSSGFRVPTPGQQNGFNISSWFDPTVGDLVNNTVIPSISPAARLRGGLPLGPEQSVNYTAGVVFNTGSFTLTADWFRIDVSDRIGITSSFHLTDAEVADLVAGGFDAAGERQELPVLHHAFATSSQGIDVITTDTPLGSAATPSSAPPSTTPPPGNRQRQGPAGRPAARRVRLRLPRTRGNIGDAAPRTGQPCSAASATTAAGTTTTAGTARSSRPPATWPRASLQTGQSFDLELSLPLAKQRRWPSAAGTSSTPTRRYRLSRGRSASGTASTCRGLQRHLLLRAHRLRLGRLSLAIRDRTAEGEGRANSTHPADGRSGRGRHRRCLPVRLFARASSSGTASGLVRRHQASPMLAWRIPKTPTTPRASSPAWGLAVPTSTTAKRREGPIEQVVPPPGEHRIDPNCAVYQWRLTEGDRERCRKKIGDVHHGPRQSNFARVRAIRVPDRIAQIEEWAAQDLQSHQGEAGRVNTQDHAGASDRRGVVL